MRRYFITFFVCLLALAACSPRVFHGEQVARALIQEQDSEKMSMQKWMEQYMHQVLQEWKNMQEWTDQISVKEVLSDPDSTGAQHVKERVTTTTTHHSEASSGSSKETKTEIQQQTDSTQLKESSSAIFKEEEQVVDGKVDGFFPWYVYAAALLAAVVVGFVLYAKKEKWFHIKSQ
jgi:hypothetical protein